MELGPLTRDQNLAFSLIHTWITLANPWHHFGLLVSQCFTRLRELPVIAIPLSAQKAWSKPATSQSCHSSNSACLSQLVAASYRLLQKTSETNVTVTYGDVQCVSCSVLVLVTSQVGTSGASMRLVFRSLPPVSWQFSSLQSSCDSIQSLGGQNWTACGFAESARAPRFLG